MTHKITAVFRKCFSGAATTSRSAFATAPTRKAREEIWDNMRWYDNESYDNIWSQNVSRCTGDKCEILTLHYGLCITTHIPIKPSLQTKTTGISAQIGTFIELEANCRAKPSLPLQNLQCTKIFIQVQAIHVHASICSILFQLPRPFWMPDLDTWISWIFNIASTFWPWTLMSVSRLLGNCCQNDLLGISQLFWSKP